MNIVYVIIFILMFAASNIYSGQLGYNDGQLDAKDKHIDSIIKCVKSNKDGWKAMDCVIDDL